MCVYARKIKLLLLSKYVAKLRRKVRGRRRLVIITTITHRAPVIPRSERDSGWESRLRPRAAETSRRAEAGEGSRSRDSVSFRFEDTGRRRGRARARARETVPRIGDSARRCAPNNRRKRRDGSYNKRSIKGREKEEVEDEGEEEEEKGIASVARGGDKENRAKSNVRRETLRLSPADGVDRRERSSR